MTVEADQSRVESRLAAGQVECPGCWAPLRAWGWAGPREVRGIAGVLRPRRSRCSACLITHVLLPVTVLARRAYAVEVIGAALLARAGGSGHRSIGEKLRVPAATVRGWLRVMTRPAGGDPAALAAGGCPGRGGPSCPEGAGLPVAGPAGRVGGGDGGGDRPVRAGWGARPGDGVAGRRGVFGWSAACSRVAADALGCREQHESPLTLRAGARNPREGCRPAGPGRVSLAESRYPW